MRGGGGAAAGRRGWDGVQRASSLRFPGRVLQAPWQERDRRADPGPKEPQELSLLRNILETRGGGEIRGVSRGRSPRREHQGPHALGAGPDCWATSPSPALNPSCSELLSGCCVKERANTCTQELMQAHARVCTAHSPHTHTHMHDAHRTRVHNTHAHTCAHVHMHTGRTVALHTLQGVYSGQVQRPMCRRHVCSLPCAPKGAGL